MPSNAPVPDYDLDDTIELTTAGQVRAISDPLTSGRPSSGTASTR
jgi:hypothetical protein